MRIYNDRYLRELPVEQFDQLEDFLNSNVSCGMDIDQFIDEMRKIKKKRERKSGVYIDTACGETHHIEPTQEVTAVYVNGKIVYEKS